MDLKKWSLCFYSLSQFMSYTPPVVCQLGSGVPGAILAGAVAGSPRGCGVFSVAWSLPCLWLCPSSAQLEWWGRKVIRLWLRWVDDYFCEALRLMYACFSWRVFSGTRVQMKYWEYVFLWQDCGHIPSQISPLVLSSLSTIKHFAESQDEFLPVQWHSMVQPP